MPFTYDELRKAGKTKIKHKGLKGSNTPKESQDFVEGLGDAVDSGPDGGNVPSGGGYGDGGGVGASIMARLVTAKKVSGTDLDWWEGLDKRKQEEYIKEHPHSKYAKHDAKQSKKKGAGLFPKWGDYMTGKKGKKDNDKKDRKKVNKAFDKVDKVFKHGPSFASLVEASIAARLENAAALTRWQSDLISTAQHDGDKVVLNGKTIWGGMGNRSGLYDYAGEVMSEKWKKSGPLFTKRVQALKAGDKVEVYQFRNVTRDRGKWVKLRTMVVKPGDL